jgi:RNA polymerase II subunit A small phosphatase-like protein
LLSLLGCCGVPDNANTLEGGDEPLPSHKLDKIPQRQLTSSRRTLTPSEQTQANGSKTQLQEREKDSQLQAGSSQDPLKSTKRVSGSTAQDQSIVGDRESESKQTTLVGAPGPSITVNPPIGDKQEAEGVAAEPTLSKDADGDVEMTDAQPIAAQRGGKAAANTDDQYQKSMPPPPPGPIPNTSSPPATQEPAEPVSTEHVPEQKWLLPPIEPSMKGKKCLVLDLDETLVHSSFKVSSQCCASSSAVFKRSHVLDFTPSRSHNTCGN